ncbi:MAG: carbohydrate ABC transporter permease [Chloroflexota bacterium]|nr:carbohydrate ABC transporter permease [Chloroflexota bacterium]
MATVTSPGDTVSRIEPKTGGHVRTVDRLSSAIMYLLLTALALISVYPFWWMIVASTRRTATILTIPPPAVPGGAILQNYNELVSQIPYWRNMINSVLVAGVHTALVLFFCSLGGYAFAKFAFPGRDKLFALMLATMMIPGVLGIIPSFMLMRWLGWLNPDWRNYLPLIIPGVANAFGIFWMRQYIMSAIPDDLMDAARIDGAHEFGIYWRIILPVITPALAALAIFTFMGKWNDFFWPLVILKERSMYTLPVALASLQSLYANELGVQLLGATIAIAPVMIVFLMSARRFMAGLTAGAIKGA